MPDNDVLHLQVPLDASSVKGFKPDRAVKVIAYGSQGPTLEQTVKFDNSGKASASFSFKQNPGSLKVALGPDNASSDDLKHMQTISTTVPASAWREKNSLTIPAVSISSYYWVEWWRWCRRFTLSGRVLCPDGSPVVGATVCAFDVDAWWWWISKEQVGCATTGTDGSFEIDFTRCCGWFPWFWWETREWLLDPYLVDRISAAFREDSTIQRLPRATPQPSLAVFEQLFASAASTSRTGRVANLAVKGNLAATGAAIDPSVLEPLRAKLQAVLPREFPLPIWPWYPWWPWFNCGANIIFQVTQNCGGKLNTVVNETVADTRWDISTDLNVTLTTNDQACCSYSCSNQDCPEGNCLVPSDICDINIGSVGGNVGNSASPAQFGLAYPGTQDRPFAGVLDLFGLFGDAVNVDYYEFQYSTTGVSGSYVPLPLAAIDAFSRQVLVVSPGPVFTWSPIGFPPNVISDGTTTHNVIETIQHYETNNGSQTWDAFTHDLLLVLNTANVLPNGTYYLQLVGWQRPGYAGDLVNPIVLPLCDPDPKDPPVDNYWVVTLDNQAPGNTDPTGQPCGLHTCTDQPISDIIQVAILHQDNSTTPIVGCGVVCITGTDHLVVDFAAYDPDGFLASYGLELLYGVDQSVPLLSLGTPTASSIAPVWAPAPPAGPNSPFQTLVGSDYAGALAQGAESPVWNGGSMRLTVKATDAFPTLPCAYLMQLNVYKRPIVNCDAVDDVQQNVSFQSFTVQACPLPS